MPEIQKSASVIGGELLQRASFGSEPESEVKSYLETELSGLSPEQKLPLLESLAGAFAAREQSVVEVAASPDEALRLMSRFLGRNFEGEGLSQEDIFEKFSVSLNTLFDSLNRIMAVINQTLLGEEAELATIRKIIGSNIDGEENYVLLTDYMERIQRSFLIAHTSFQEASSTLLGEILVELDPEALSKSLSSGLKFGALRKAELFDMYDEKFVKLKRWFESGQYKEQLLREFERRCQREIH
jgi:hypothetical protein